MPIYNFLESKNVEFPKKVLKGGFMKMNNNSF